MSQRKLSGKKYFAWLGQCHGKVGYGHRTWHMVDLKWPRWAQWAYSEGNNAAFHERNLNKGATK
jgi:hypothetical protein